MTIVALFRRYKRWNPVHPTFGAFWGIGVGFGCGVGWGPGFGPDAVGFVGAGCGVGFSVGVTLIGVGLGLPASGLTSLPYETLIWTGRGASNITTNYAVPALVFGFKQSLEAVALQSAALGRNAQSFYESELPKSRRFISKLQRRVFRGSTEEEEEEKEVPIQSLTQKSTNSHLRLQNVTFSRSYKWIKDSESGISSPPRNGQSLSKP